MMVSLRKCLLYLFNLLCWVAIVASFLFFQNLLHSIDIKKFFYVTMFTGLNEDAAIGSYIAILDPELVQLSGKDKWVWPW